MGDQDKQRRRDILSGRVAGDDNKEEQAEAGKGLGRTDMNYGTIQGVEGRTIGGSGGGTGTGDPSGDFDRPGTEGKPAMNDYVESDWPKVNTSNRASDENVEETNQEEDKVDVPSDIKRADPRSGYPLGGAARGTEDRV
jgi:hypothetical protein